MPKAIFFDAAGTLIHLPRSVGEHYREVAARFGAALDATALERAFREAWAAAPARPAQDTPREDDDKGWWRTLVGQVLTRVLSADQAKTFDGEAFFEAAYAHFAEPGVWQAYPDVQEVLGRLRQRGYKLGVISNFDRRLYAVLDELKLTPFFEAILISSEVGADKPDPRIFVRALQTFRVAPSEALHVGDDPKRDWGAEALGLRVFRLERPGHTFYDLLAALEADGSGEKRLQPGGRAFI